MQQISKIAVVGTGIMGAPIAGHLMDAGYDVTVYNRTRQKAEALLARGAHWASTPGEAAADADVTFTMVGYPEDVEDVYLGADGILAAARKGSYLIDLTTSSPVLAREIHDAAEVQDVHAFDCPVTGGQAGAEAGTLTLIAGASEADVEDVRDVLMTFGKELFCFGEAGMGQLAKLCNQVSLASCMVGMADAMALARQGGLDVAQMLQMVSGGMGRSCAIEQLAPKALAGDYEPGFLSEHMLKDLGMALATAEDLELTLPGTQTAFGLYDLLCTTGGSRKGTQAITLLYEDEATSTAAGLDWSALDADEDGGHDHECDCGHDHHHDHDHECHCHDHGGEA